MEQQKLLMLNNRELIGTHTHTQSDKQRPVRLKHKIQHPYDHSPGRKGERG